MKEILVALTLGIFTSLVTPYSESYATEIVTGGVIHFRGEIVTGQCDYNFSDNNQKVTEECYPHSPVSYAFNIKDGLANYQEINARITHEVISERVVMFNVVYY